MDAIIHYQILKKNHVTVSHACEKLCNLAKIDSKHNPLTLKLVTNVCMLGREPYIENTWYLQETWIGKPKS